MPCRTIIDVTSALVAKQNYLPLEIFKNSAKVKYDLELKYCCERKKNSDRSTHKAILIFSHEGKGSADELWGYSLPSTNCQAQEWVIPHDLLHLHCQRSTPQDSLTKHPFCGLFSPKIFNLFILSQAAPSSAITFGKVLRGLMDLNFRHLTIHNMALLQTFNSKFLSDSRLGNKTAYGSLSL